MSVRIEQFIINSSSYQVTLVASEGELSAEASKDSSKTCFTSSQIKYGIAEDLPHQDLVSKVQELTQEKLYAFLYPKKEPKELWIFEAININHLQITKGKEHCITENYEKALKCFETALKLAHKANPNAKHSQLESSISFLKSKNLLSRWKGDVTNYLPDLEGFEEMIEPYEDETDLVGNLKELLSVEKTEPHQILLSAFINEEEGNFEEAAQDYLLLAEGNPKLFACVVKAYSFIENSEKRDAVRIVYEELLATIDKKSLQVKAPTCFICFNVSEKDVGKWLSKNLVPDLDLAGIKPLFCFSHLTAGANLDTFQELARTADSAMIACTPLLKQKCEERKKSPIGVAQEVQMIKGRFNDPEKAGSTYPLFLKGSRKKSLPSYYFESIFGVKFSSENSLSSETDFAYFYHAFPLLTALRKLSREESEVLQETLLTKTCEILLGGFDSSKISEWRAKKEDRIKSVQKISQERVSALTQVVNLPLPPKNFTGREKQIKDLHDACKAEHRIAVSGLGGVGKTALALEYANQYKSHYQFVHFSLATTAQMVRNGLIKLANDLHVPTLEKEEERLEWLKVALEKLDQEYLLIFDGVDHPEVFDEIEKWVPERGRSLLLTSRMSVKAEDMSYKLLLLGKFSPEEAFEYLHKVTNFPHDADADTLASKLGCLPLALKHAAIFIRQRNISYKKYLEEFEKENFALFSRKRVKNLPADEYTILKTWLISLEAIRTFHNCELAADIFDFLSILAKAEIPLDLVEIFSKQAFSNNKTPVIDAIALLSDYSLIEKSSPGNWHIHALVQDVTRSQLEEEKNKKYQFIILRALAGFFGEANIESLETCLELERHVIHAETILENNIPISEETEKFEDFQSLSNSLYEYYDFRGIYQSTLANAERLLEIRQQILGEKRPSVATSLNYIGLSLGKLGRHEEALKYLKKALKLSRALFGEKHPGVASCLNNVGLSLGELGRHAEALMYLKEALELGKDLLGENHPDVASILNNVGLSLGKLRRYEEALENLKKALKLRRVLLGEKHPDVASSMDNVGGSLGELTRHEEALRYLKDALELRRVLLGRNHPDVASSLNNVGSSLRELGRYEEAMEYLKNALELSRALLGKNHPDVASSLNNVGLLFVELERLEEALKYLKEALELRRALLGKNHPDVAASLRSVGGALDRLKRHEEALRYLKEGLELNRALFGENHPDVVTSLSNVGISLRALGRHEEALKYLKEGLELNRALFGENHPDVVTSLSNVGISLRALGRHEEALKYLKEDLELSRALFGENHLDVATSLNNVGSLLYDLERYEEALKYLKEALELMKILLGENHLDVAANLNNVGITLSELERYEEALKYLKEALEIRKSLLGERDPLVGASLTMWHLLLRNLDGIRKL